MSVDTTTASGTPTAPQAAHEPAPPNFWTWLGFAAMALGNFMAILDIQIVASSIRNIQAGISASADELAWVQTAYLIAEVIAIPLSGYLSRAFSIPVFFAWAATGFAFASAACGLAWNTESMIVFRAIQGFMGGALIPTTMASAWLLFPPKYRGGVQIMIGMIVTIAPSIGPTVGGTITDALGWRWLFFINLVPAAVIAVLVPFCLRGLPKANPSLLKKMDWIGLFSLAVFLGSLQLYLEDAPGDQWFGSAKIVSVFLVCLIAASVFFWRALTVDEPIVSLKAFRNRNFAIGALVTFSIGIGLYGSVYLQPLFLSQIRGFGALQIGHVMFATGAAMFVTAPIIRTVGDRVDMRILVAIGIVIAALGCFTQSGLTAESDFDEFILPQALRGMGFMFVFALMTQLAFATLPPEEIQTASGLFNLMRNLGGALGVAVLNALKDYFLVFHKTMLAPMLDPANPLVAARLTGLQAAMEKTEVSDPYLAAVAQMTFLLNREATVMTFNNLFFVMGIIFLLSLFAMPFLEKAKAETESTASDAH